jgi:nucleotide-binding universal stress UspA family protein
MSTLPIPKSPKTVPPSSVDCGQYANTEKAIIAVGSRGLGAVRRVRLGSVSTKVFHVAEVPVLVSPRS